MNTKINTFIFDCFAVIFSPPISGWHKENITNLGLVDEKLNDLLNDYDLGNLSEDDIVEHFSKHEGVNLTKEKIQEGIDSHLKLDNSLVDIILKLKNKGFKIVLLSNGNAAFFKRKIYADYPEFKKLFNEIVISSEVGIIKPDKEIFLHTLQKINSKPEESLFIDDRQINVDGSLSVGMQGFLYTDSNSFAEYIKNLGIYLD